MTDFKELEKQYNEKQKERKEKIKSEPNKVKRFFMYIWELICFPFVWIFYNIRDWHTALIFGICFIVLSVEVWLPYLLGFIFWGTEFGNWCIGIASACWLFWLGPGTPFTLLVIFMTISVKAIFNKIKK